MRATNDRLAEKYIVIVARELAKALKGLHAAGIIHRDVKGMFLFLVVSSKADGCSHSGKRPHSRRRPTTAMRLWSSKRP